MVVNVDVWGLHRFLGRRNQMEPKWFTTFSKLTGEKWFDEMCIQNNNWTLSGFMRITTVNCSTFMVCGSYLMALMQYCSSQKEVQNRKKQHFILKSWPVFWKSWRTLLENPAEDWRYFWLRRYASSIDLYEPLFTKHESSYPKPYSRL